LLWFGMSVDGRYRSSLSWFCDRIFVSDSYIGSSISGFVWFWLVSLLMFSSALYLCCRCWVRDGVFSVDQTPIVP